jgi:hypothetical protein
LYLADTNSKNVYFAPAAGFTSYVGDVIVGTEKPPDKSSHFWIIQPKAGSFQIAPLMTDLPSQDWNFESAVYVP